VKRRAALALGAAAVATVRALESNTMPKSAPAEPAAASETRFYPPYAGDAGGREQSASVTVQALPGGLCEFTLTTTQAQRDNTPQRRVVADLAGSPRTATGSPLFDALFAMALDDARLNSVSEIRDGAYNGGQPIPCACFQTGEKWHYVWTRDLAYAAHLGLGWLDPARTVTSLRFKTSGFRAGVALPEGLPADSLQIIQDTGSGGSWPVSTDRVTWAWGADAALRTLPPEARQPFADEAYRALRGTIEADRVAAFDAGCGLYGGEQSFLDWRTQSYAAWIVNNLSRMAGSKALSTNVSHWQALNLAAQLAREHGDTAIAQRYRGWADALKTAINRVFWLDDVGAYASLTTDDEQPLALHQFDLLGTALAVVSGVAPPERAALALAHYPHAPYGAPVISPQQAGIRAYHNRAIWPFVSAYALRAAAQVHNPVIAAQACASLQRAAALNLSNMENLEWLTAQAEFDDGPVINSRRQLWSVAAYLSLVVDSIFGVQPTADGLRIAPFLTATARRSLGRGDSARLQDLQLQGRAVNVRLQLPPPVDTEGWYPVTEVRLNGQVVDAAIARTQLREGVNDIDVRFAPLQADDTRITESPTVDPRSHDDPRVFAPLPPTVALLGREGDAQRLRISAPRNAAGRALRYRLFRDGVPVAELPGAGDWTQAAALRSPGRHHYAAIAIDTQHGHHSHPSEPAVDDGEGAQDVQIGVPFALATGGRVGFELVYDNHAGHIETGVTNAVKVLRVLDASGREVARGVVQMPHLDAEPGAAPTGLSTVLRATLPAGRYRLVLDDHFNMSALAANARYAGAGGEAGPLNHAEVLRVRVFALPARPAS
jgi:hypothetical protein